MHTQDGGSDDAETVSVIDFPGHATLRPQMAGLWNDIGGVVLAVDSKLSGDTVRDTAE